MSAPFHLPATADVARTLHARRALEAAVEHGIALMAALGLPPIPSVARAITLLDAIDAPEEDLEPSLGYQSPGSPLDGEADDCDDEDDGCAEPSLGAPEQHENCGTYCKALRRWIRVPPDQRHWAAGGSHDREGDVVDEPHDDEDDEEPSLGWPEDFTAKLDDVLQADHDPELDDADLEDSDEDDRFPWPDGAPVELMTGGRHA